MNRLLAPLFLLSVAAALTYAFSGRVAPPIPATAPQIGNTLILDAELAGERVVAVGDRGAVFVQQSADTWQLHESGTSSMLNALYFGDARRGWAVGHDGVIISTDDAGASWRTAREAPDEERPLLDVRVGADGRGFAVGAYGAYLETRDGGRSWVERTILEDDRHLNAIARLPDGTLFIVGEAGTLLRSTDEGATWVPLVSPYQGSFFGALATASGRLLVFGMRGHLFRSDDRGESFVQIPVAQQLALYGGRVLADGGVIVTGQDGLMLISRDGGERFEVRHLPGNRLHAAVVASARGELLAFGEKGVTQVSQATPPALAQAAQQ